MIFLEPFAKAFLGLHLLTAIASLFFLFLAVLYLILRETPEWRLGTRLTLLGGLMYTLTWALGLLIYPVFRVRVRAEYFDPSLPWATGLFEIKEHIGSLGLFATLALITLTLISKNGTKDEASAKKLYRTLLLFVFLITVFKAAVGFFLRGLRSI